MSQPEGNRPVYVCLAGVEVSRALAEDLRAHGTRARAFASRQVLERAAEHEAPLATVIDADALADEHATILGELIAVVADSGLSAYLEAIRSGADSVITDPINRPALRHHLRGQARFAAQPARVAVIADDERIAQRLRDRDGLSVTTLAPADEALMRRLEDAPPDLMIIDADITEPSAELLMIALRQRPVLRIPPVLALTRADKRTLDPVAQRAGLDGIIGPMPADDLKAIIDNRLMRNRMLLDSWRLLARRDPETGLYRRAELEQALASAVGGARSTPAMLLTVSLEPGDEPGGGPPGAIVTAAQQLWGLLPALSLPARVDRYRFAILLNGMLPASGRNLADQLQEKLSEVVGASLGVYVEAQELGPESDSGTLLATAGRAAPQSVSVGDSWRQRVTTALDEDRFRLVYQPISGLHGQPCSFYEVFLRLLDETGAEVAPSAFLPALDGSPLAARLDRWVFCQALHVLVQRQAEAQERPTLFVKISAEGLADPGFADWLQGQQETAGISPEQLVVEIPSAAITSAAGAEAAARLAARTRVAVEHVNRVETLKAAVDKLRPAYIKLHAELTAPEASNDGGDSLQAIAGAARQAGVRMVATQVQDAGTLAMLWGAGVDYVQGHFMQAPGALFTANASTTG